MRYEWGLGVGHTYSHKDATAANLEALCAWIPPVPDASVSIPVEGDLADLPAPVESTDERSSGNGTGTRVEVGDSGDSALTSTNTNAIDHANTDDSTDDHDSIDALTALALAAADDDDDDDSDDDEDGTSDDSDQDDDPHRDFDSEDEREVILFGWEEC